MTFSLQTDPKVKYSPNEKHLFSLLGADERSSTDLATRFYKIKGKQMPFNARKIVVGLVSGVQKKVAANREPFRVMKSERNGPHPIMIWLERRK